MRSLLRRAALLGCVAIAAVVVPAGAASAHPLGNFTVNSYSGVVAAPDSMRLDHVMDYAEIPTVQQRRAIAGDLVAYAARSCTSATRTLSLVVEGTRAPLAVHASSARLLPGAAGLQTLRLECDLRADVTLRGRTSVVFHDAAAADHVGWHEVTVRGDGATISGSDAPTDSVSKRLTSYPQNMLKSPADQQDARFTVRPGGARLVESTRGEALVSRPADAMSRAFTGLVGEGGLGVGAVVLALLLAAAIGAAHAVAPGHGKTIMAFYLAGRQARSLRAALTVGTTVTATHTAGVLALGALVTTGAAFTPTHAYPWLSMISGVVVLAVGLNLVRNVRRGGGPSRPHSHGGLTHSHGGAAHSHGGAAHSHGPAAGSRRGPLTSPTVLVRAGGATSITTLELPAALTGTPAAHADDHHGHDHDHHDHGHHDHHDDDHDHHDHDHGQDTGAPRRGGLVAMGLAGGLVPSPTAVVVLLGAVATGHWWLGIALVLAFGVGMALTLTTVGILVATAGDRLRTATDGSSRLSRLSGPVLRWAPAAAAVGVCVLGAVVVLRGFLAL